MYRKVHFRDDILRGLRLGGFLLAFLFAGVAAYRISKEPRATESVQVPDPPPADAPKADVKPKLRDPWAGPAIPPPPPSGRRSAAHRAAASPAAPAPVPTPAPAATEPAPAPLPSVAEHVEIEKADVPVKAPTAGVREESPAPAASDENQKSDNRAKRALKAVGRFLHIIHSDPY